MKVLHSTKKVYSFGGLFSTFSQLSQTGLEKTITKILGNRSSNAGYSYYDIVCSLLANVFCHGTHIEDVNHIRSTQPEGLPVNLCSADTISYVLEELSVNDRYFPGKGTLHFLNTNKKINRLLIKSARKLKMIGSEINMDFDAVILPTEKQDTCYTYKGCLGYQPTVAFAGRIPLYIQGRNGNTNAKSFQYQTLKNCFDLLKENRIKVKRFRADCASFQYNVIRLLNQRCDEFYLRMPDLASHIDVADIENWKRVKINGSYYEVATTEWFHPDYKKPFRVVVQRKKSKDGQGNLFTNDDNIYRGILTNNWTKTNKKVIINYNQRGDSERNFDILNNDFNWDNLPSSDMKNNVVYMGLMALCMMIFEYLKKRFAKIHNVCRSWRLKKYILHCIIKPYAIVRHARRVAVKFYNGYVPPVMGFDIPAS